MNAKAVIGALTASLLIGSGWSSAFAQIIGPGPKQGKLQVGGWWAFLNYDRLTSYSPVDRPDYHPGDRDDETERDFRTDRAALSMRYGVTDGSYLILNFGFLQRDRELHPAGWDTTIDYNTLEGVWGIGGNIRILSRGQLALRIGGHYNDVFEFERQRDVGPWRSRDTRAVLAVDRSMSPANIPINVAVGLLYFSSREKGYTVPEAWHVARDRNRHN